ncbi:hypothetical protein VPH5P1C_0130 [Vibrio phage 5P1c]
MSSGISPRLVYSTQYKRPLTFASGLCHIFKD